MSLIPNMQTYKSPNLFQPLFHKMLHCILILTSSFISMLSSCMSMFSLSYSSSSLYKTYSSFISMHFPSSQPITFSVSTITSSSSFTSMSNFILLTSYVPSDDVGNASEVILAVLAENLCSSVKPT